MIRSGTDAGAQNAMVALTSSLGMTFQYRVAAGSTSYSSEFASGLGVAKTGSQG